MRCIRLYPHTFLLVLSSLLGCGDRQGDVGKGDHAIEGTWNGIGAQDFAHVGEFPVVWHIDGNAITERILDLESKKDYVAVTSRQPYEIDITLRRGINAGQTAKGIYKIVGGKLYICHITYGAAVLANPARPTDFDTTKRKDIVVLTFSREGN